jgi:hypothetical protein
MLSIKTYYLSGPVAWKQPEPFKRDNILKEPTLRGFGPFFVV